MAITTYSELQTAVGNWLSRSDQTSRVTEYIALCEAKLQRELRTLDMETKISSVSIASEYATVPADFLQVRSFKLDATRRQPLRYMADDLMSENYDAAATDSPRFYNVQSNLFRFAPVPDATYSATLVYYAKIPALSNSNTTNWVLTNHPDVYLYGSLLEATAGPIQFDADTVTKWKSAYDMAVMSINGAASRNRWSGPGLQTRPG